MVFPRARLFRAPIWCPSGGGGTREAGSPVAESLVALYRVGTHQIRRWRREFFQGSSMAPVGGVVERQRPTRHSGRAWSSRQRSTRQRLSIGFCSHLGLRWQICESEFLWSRVTEIPAPKNSNTETMNFCGHDKGSLPPHKKLLQKSVFGGSCKKWSNKSRQPEYWL